MLGGLFPFFWFDHRNALELSASQNPIVCSALECLCILPCSFWFFPPLSTLAALRQSRKILTSFPCWKTPFLVPSFSLAAQPKIAVKRSPARCSPLPNPALPHGWCLMSFFPPLGIKDSDRSELGRIASDPTAEHVLYVEDFQLLPNVAPKLSRRLCFTASEPPRPAKLRLQGEPSFSLHPAFQTSLWMCFHGDQLPTSL